MNESEIANSMNITDIRTVDDSSINIVISENEINEPVHVINDKTKKEGGRKRVVLSLPQRLELIGRLNNGEKFSDLAREFNIGRVTIRDIYKRRHEYLKFVQNADSFNAVLQRKTLARTSLHELDQAVYKWYKEHKNQGIPVTGAMITEIALKLHKEMGIKTPFSGSSGWADRFRKRHGIRTFKKQLYAEETDPYFEQVLMQAEQEQKPALTETIHLKTEHNTSSDYDTPDFYLQQNAIVEEAEEFEETYDKEVPSCSTTTEVRDDNQLQQFTTYLMNEMKNLKSPSLVRKLKMDIMKLVYDAQNEDEKSN